MNGYKSYVAAFGMLGLCIYQLSQGEIEQGVSSFFAALAILGIRHAIK